ncbi:hypothetical protein NDU88_003162 [Pleurodeles waltl]|uniref:Uncharacterized protein n=1 Tax=Pleurodeles waltl TaxID=8319 RepID=A0AAV7WNA9_PLEWA|nr:hypothetical protein NDU88_003162 [Pleurodeles waltl]
MASGERPNIADAVTSPILNECEVKLECAVPNCSIACVHMQDKGKGMPSLWTSRLDRDHVDWLAFLEEVPLEETVLTGAVQGAPILAAESRYQAAIGKQKESVSGTRLKRPCAAITTPDSLPGALDENYFVGKFTQMFDDLKASFSKTMDPIYARLGAIGLKLDHLLHQPSYDYIHRASHEE